ncbi:unnamed protein product [Acanthoscelides obtectus]|uniref:Uncharacterized protein n=1 Tax=Acanthoscelides obtectus TaxID=200917 RepID=A0A9P0KHL7_ACAOB|nr:unnamed protein product [Acanthoscelides obtectus]CAK1667488.1 hypothetical protein AOBTE_LOCUS25867 [Acanthoscelides obtectus]
MLILVIFKCASNTERDPPGVSLRTLLKGRINGFPNAQCGRKR